MDKKFLIKLPAALIIALILLVVSDHVFMPKYIDENQDGRITREFYTQAEDPDIIFLGSSTVHYCISPDRLWSGYAVTSYDRSNASQTMWQSYYLLKDALAYGHPSLVALDVSFIKNGEEFIEEPSNRKAIECMRDPAAKLGAVMSSAGDFEQPVSYFFPVLRYHSRWKELSRNDIRYAFDREMVTFDGYLMDFSIPEEQHIYEPEPTEDTAFPQKSLDFLDRINDLCKKEGIGLLLMKTPTFVNNWHREYDDVMRSIAGGYGVTYINFTDRADRMGIDVRYDYIDDGEHMNVVGAHKFTDYLGKYLCENYELPSHEGDEHLKAIWDEKRERYEKAVSEGMDKYEECKESIR